MRLAAVYIPKNTLPHLFGENHNEYTLNLGGQSMYEFKENNSIVELNKVSLNENFVENFWGNDISLVSAIIGKNGVGKSSILRAMNHSIDPESKKLIYLLETNSLDKLKIINGTEFSFSDNCMTQAEVIEGLLFETLYYSPNLDFEIIDSLSPITLISYFTDSFEDYFLDSVSRNVSFLNDPIVEDIKYVYDDFPSYDIIDLKAKKLRKSRIRAPYLESNFGTPHRGDALRNELIAQIMQLKDKKSEKENYTNDDFIESHQKSIQLLDSESFTQQFNKLWDLDDYKYLDESGYDFIHNSTDFIKNTEINILSYLLLGATFAQTGLGGGIDFSRISDTYDFHERMNLFLEMYLFNEHRNLANQIAIKLSGIRVENSIEIIKEISDYRYEKELGTDLKPIKEKMIMYSESFNLIFNFYEELKQWTKSKAIFFENGSVVFNIKDHESMLQFDELVFQYKFILKAFPKCPINISLFDFYPNKKLSTGEKAILDFYSSMYNHIDTSKESLDLNYDYYLLLLDEPDLGFHPMWKKKFINAISKTLPILFSKINPQKYDRELKEFITTRENPIVQIIFSTHDPLTISDIPNRNIVYIDKDDNSSFIVNENNRPKKSFGANITDLLADSFFVHDGLIGDFAKEKIDLTINWINSQKELKEVLKMKYAVDIVQYEYHKKIISIIDEHVIRLKLAEMLEELKGEKKLQEELIDREIKHLQEKKNSL